MKNKKSLLDSVFVRVTSKQRIANWDTDDKWLCLGDYDNMNDFMFDCYHVCLPLEDDPDIVFISWKFQDDTDDLCYFVGRDYIHPNIFLLKQLDSGLSFFIDSMILSKDINQDIIDDVWDRLSDPYWNS